MRRPPFSVLTRGADKVCTNAKLCLLTALCLFQTLCTGAYVNRLNEPIQMSIKYIGFGKKMRQMWMAEARFTAPYLEPCRHLHYSEKYYNIGTSLYYLSIVSMRITVSGGGQRSGNYVCADL